MSHRFKDARAF